MSNQPPVDTIRDRNLRADIWRNEKDGKADFVVEFYRTYKDDAGNYHKTNTLRDSDVLRAEKVLDRAYDKLTELKRDVYREPGRTSEQSDTSREFDRSRRSAPRARR